MITGFIACDKHRKNGSVLPVLRSLHSNVEVIEADFAVKGSCASALRDLHNVVAEIRRLAAPWKQS